MLARAQMDFWFFLRNLARERELFPPVMCVLQAERAIPDWATLCIPSVLSPCAESLGMIERDTLNIETRGRSLVDITDRVAKTVARCRAASGSCNLFIQHTSASLIISENADSAVCRDLERFFSRLAADGDPLFEHDAEGPDDMPAHVRSVLTGVSLTIPIQDGRMLLGTWQGIFVWEHRHDAHRRTVIVTAQGE